MMIPSTTSAFHIIYQNRTYWSPFLTNVDYLPEVVRTNIKLILQLEILGHIFSILSIISFTFVIWKVSAMPFNLIVLNTYAVSVLGLANLLLRIPLILIELEVILLHDIQDIFIQLSIAKMFVWVSIYNYVTYITFERCMATKLTSSYENKNHGWISSIAIIVNSLFSAAASVMLIYALVDGIFYVAVVFLMSNVSCGVYWYTTRVNKKQLDNMRKFQSRRIYSIGERWQIVDNIRLSKDIRFLVYGCAAQVAFYLSLFFVPPLVLHGDEWRPSLEAGKAAFQLACAYGFGLCYVFLIFCIQRQSIYVQSLFCGQTSTNNRIYPVNDQTIDEHFISINETWNNVWKERHEMNIHSNCVVNVHKS